MTGTIEKEIAELERCIKYPHTDKPVVELAKLVVLKRWLAHAEAQDKHIRDLEAEKLYLYKKVEEIKTELAFLYIRFLKAQEQLRESEKMKEKFRKQAWWLAQKKK